MSAAKVQWGLQIITAPGRPPTISEHAWRELRFQTISTWRGSLFSDFQHIWGLYEAAFEEAAYHNGADGLLHQHAKDLIEWYRVFRVSLIEQGSRHAMVDLACCQLIWVFFDTDDTDVSSAQIVRIDLRHEGNDPGDAVSVGTVDPRTLVWND